MEKKERIARTLSNVMHTMDVPAFKNMETGNFRDISFSDNLDSLGMVNLIIGMEDALRQEFGKDVPILGREAFNTASIQSAGMFIDYLDQIV
jgi:hypothetical protein